MIKVNSEIGRLRKVLLHRPGSELSNLTPDTLEELLFDDVPWLEEAQREHDIFAETLKSAGVEVVYLEDLVAEVLEDNELKEQFVEQFMSEEEKLVNPVRIEQVRKYLLDMKPKDLVIKTMEGIRIDELPKTETRTLSDLVDNEILVTRPMPNLYFTRDPFSCIQNGVSINRMYSVTRNRETIYGEYIFKYHKTYKDTNKFYERNGIPAIEGGDILVIDNKTIAVGISQRTTAVAIEAFARNIITDKSNEVTAVLGFDIPKTRAFMHLDTVFTQIDYDKFTIHGGIEDSLIVYEMTMKQDEFTINPNKGNLEELLSKYIGKKVEIIRCAGGDPIMAEIEQWNDGANTLAISPGEVVVYSRNTITNEILESKGIKLHIIPSGELSRGRGGPRCMSMPLERDEIK